MQAALTHHLQKTDVTGYYCWFLPICNEAFILNLSSLRRWCFVWISGCLADISVWMPIRHLKLNLIKRWDYLPGECYDHTIWQCPKPCWSSSQPSFSSHRCLLKCNLKKKQQHAKNPRQSRNIVAIGNTRSQHKNNFQLKWIMIIPPHQRISNVTHHVSAGTFILTT